MGTNSGRRKGRGIKGKKQMNPLCIKNCIVKVNEQMHEIYIYTYIYICVCAYIHIIYTYISSITEERTVFPRLYDIFIKRGLSAIKNVSIKQIIYTIASDCNETKLQIT